MSKVLTSDEIIVSLKRRGMVPTNQNTFDADDFLEILDEEIDMYIMPYLLSVHEEYNVYYEDQDLVDGQAEYIIPYRSIGNKLRGLFYMDDQGNMNKMTRVKHEDKDTYGSNTGNYSGPTQAFYVENNKIVLVNESNGQGSLRFYFYLRPNKLVPNDEGGVISAIDTATGVVTLSNLPTDFASLPEMDFVSAKSPNQIKGYDLQPSAINTTTKTITFTASDLPSDLVVGDYLNVAGEAIVPQIPTELHGLLAQKGALTCIEAMGDLESSESVRRKLEKMEQKIFNVIDNRVESAVLKVKNKNGLLATAMGKFRNYYN